MKIMCSERLQKSERMIRIKYFEINTWKRNVKRREKNVEINDIPCELRKLN